ncbi:hypothetical protein FH972_022464 [Carpinus fangiana]|uniref:DNA replication checkpoint mediator MRC1 domain-containing protein n=1 Tax=Carpinus fangiana TaxID=176857 RepID=A0A5N6KSC0_9ROSI|nr:hypothetical protein FH972_022464 [Carpinus fangiana]
MESPTSSQELRASQTSLHLSDSGSDKENTVSARKGLVSSLQRISHALLHQPSSSEDEDDNDAYERVRRQLLGASTNKQPTEPLSPQQDSVSEDHDAAASDSLNNQSMLPKGRMARRMQNLFQDDTEDDFERDNIPASLPAKPQTNVLRDTDLPNLDSEDELAASPSNPPETNAKRATTPSPSRSSVPQANHSLFVSPQTSPTSKDVPDLEDVDNEIPAIPNRLQALIARKREERLAKERAVEEARQVSESDEMPQQMTQLLKKKRKQPVIPAAGSEDDSADDNDQKLTQHNKPTRKASKKAIEDMNRETQRMQRNMQLTHQAKTKTKFTTEDLFKKLNFRQTRVKESSNVQALLPSAAVSSDAENATVVDTPPSSPPSVVGEAEKTVAMQMLETTPRSGDDSESDSLQQAFRATRKKSPQPVQETMPMLTKQKLSVREFMKRSGKRRALQLETEDLELVRSKNYSGLAVLDRKPSVKVRESHAVHALHALAHLHDHDAKPRSRAARKSYAPSELSAHLRQLARRQAMAERDEKIQALKDRGIYVQTAEERERDQLQLENMLEKARQEAEELAQREKDAAKRDGKDVDNGFPDSDEDEDYVASGDEDVLDLSGSEDEGSQGDDEDSQAEGDELEDEQQDLDARGQLIEDAASEDEEEDDGDDGEAKAETNTAAQSGAEIGENFSTPSRRVVAPRNRKTLITSEDEDELMSPAVRTPDQARTTPKTPKSALAAAFGFGQAPEPGLGLSQMFAGTMAESQDNNSDIHNAAMDSQQDSLAFLRGIVPPSMPNFGGVDSPVAGREAQGIIVQNSQAEETQLDGEESQQGLGEVSASQVLDATQDEGFQTVFSPAKPMGGTTNAPHSTIDTVLLNSPIVASSPIVTRKGRLQRRKQDDMEIEADDVEDDGADPGLPANAFHVMRKAASKPSEEEYDRKKSEAKGMVEEQAEESEDEYAGLGGASDDESTGELDEEMKKQLIDDVTKEKLNERQVAAFFADKERADDEKRVEKLFKDIANGGLRRKRGADLELWDSDDEDEAAKRRRAMKQREFARMRRALLADEKLGKIAENPKQAAFLQAIEDREDEEEVFFLDTPENGGQESQPQAVAASPESLDAEESSRKRKREDDVDSDDDEQIAERPAAPLRRTGRLTKPTTLQDIRNTLSELIGDSNEAEDGEQEEMVLDSQPLDRGQSYSPELEAAAAEEASPAEGADGSRWTGAEARNPRRTPASSTRIAVIDRIAMKRSRSSSLTSKQSASAAASRQAFFAPSAAGSTSFKVPSLLRRATTNASNASDGSDKTGLSTGGMGKEVIKMGGSKKSSVNYYVREKERRAKVEEVERGRDEARKKVGMLRRKEVGAGLGGRGRRAEGACVPLTRRSKKQQYQCQAQAMRTPLLFAALPIQEYRSRASLLLPPPAAPLLCPLHSPQWRVRPHPRPRPSGERSAQSTDHEENQSSASEGSCAKGRRSNTRARGPAFSKALSVLLPLSAATHRHASLPGLCPAAFAFAGGSRRALAVVCPMARFCRYTNTSASDCTVAIPQAGLLWWYTHTYKYASQTYQILLSEPATGRPYATAYTTVTFADQRTTRSLNVTSLLASPTFETRSVGTVSNGRATVITTLSPVSTPTPVAPHTIALVRQSVNPIPTSATINPRNFSDRYQLTLPASAYKTLGRATTTLAEAEPSTTPTTITSATPFLRFTNYEIISHSTTITYNLTRPVGYALESQDFNGVLSASGTIPADFTDAIGSRSSCTLASWAAKPTVIVVVEIIYAIAAVLAAHTELSQTALDIPTPYASPTGPGQQPIGPTGQVSVGCLEPRCTIVYFSGHLESTQASLDIPTTSFIVPGPTVSQPGITPDPDVATNNRGRQQQVDGVVTAPDVQPPITTPAPTSPPDAAQLALLLSILSRVGDLTTPSAQPTQAARPDPIPPPTNTPGTTDSPLPSSSHSRLPSPSAPSASSSAPVPRISAARSDSSRPTGPNAEPPGTEPSAAAAQPSQRTTPNESPTDAGTDAGPTSAFPSTPLVSASPSAPAQGGSRMLSAPAVGAAAVGALLALLLS